MSDKIYHKMPGTISGEDVESAPTPMEDARELAERTMIRGKQIEDASSLFWTKNANEAAAEIERFVEAQIAAERERVKSLSELVEINYSGRIKAEAEVKALREVLKSIATMPEYDQDDAYRLRDKARAEAAESLLVTERAEIARGHALLEAAEAEAKALRDALVDIGNRGANPITGYGYGKERPWIRLADDVWGIARSALDGSGKEQIQEENV